jgi:hypothetical protein
LAWNRSGDKSNKTTVSESRAAVGPRFIAREAELARVMSALETTMAGIVRFILVAGEPGIGKNSAR